VTPSPVVPVPFDPSSHQGRSSKKRQVKRQFQHGYHGHHVLLLMDARGRTLIAMEMPRPRPKAHEGTNSLNTLLHIALLASAFCALSSVA